MPALSLQNPAARRAAWIVLGLLLLVSFWIDFAHTQSGGSIDLRNRVTGARLFFAHIDPYFYKWAEPQPPEYCDPYNNPQLPVSKTTATPALLLSHFVLAMMPYRLAQFSWLAAQWLLLLGTGWLWLRLLPSEEHRLLLTSFITGFTYTAAWRLHAERGQSYVLLLFLFAVWLAGTWRSWPSFWLGLLAGVLATLRPPFLLLAPFALLHRRWQLPGMALGAVLGIVLPMIWNADCWTNYSNAMQSHSEIYRAGIDPAPGPERFPSEIEDMPTDTLLANYIEIPYADFSIHALLRGFKLEPFPAWPPLVLIGAGFAAWLWFSRKQASGRLLLGAAIWYFGIDLCLPAYRDNYNDVLVIAVVALALTMANRAPRGLWLCFAGLPLGWLIDASAPRHDWMIDIPSFSFALGAVLLLFWYDFPARAREI